MTIDELLWRHTVLGTGPREVPVPQAWSARHGVAAPSPLSPPGQPKHAHLCATCRRDFDCYTPDCLVLSVGLCAPCARTHREREE